MGGKQQQKTLFGNHDIKYILNILLLQSHSHPARG